MDKLKIPVSTVTNKGNAITNQIFNTVIVKVTNNDAG